MATIQPQWRVLEAAFDELNLWDLPGRHIYVHSGGQSVTADLSLGDVRDALSQALRAGFVVLYDPEDSSYRRLDLEDALSLIAHDDEWDATTASRRAALAITPEGESASHRVFDQYRKSSPFGALGIVDPHVITDDTAGS